MQCEVCAKKLKVDDVLEVKDGKYCHRECIDSTTKQKNIYSKYNTLSATHK